MSLLKDSDEEAVPKESFLGSGTFCDIQKRQCINSSGVQRQNKEMGILSFVNCPRYNMVKRDLSFDFLRFGTFECSIIFIIAFEKV